MVSEITELGLDFPLDFPDGNLVEKGLGPDLIGVHEIPILIHQMRNHPWIGNGPLYRDPRKRQVRAKTEFRV